MLLIERRDIHIFIELEYARENSLLENVFPQQAQSIIVVVGCHTAAQIEHLWTSELFKAEPKPDQLFHNQSRG